MPAVEIKLADMQGNRALKNFYSIPLTLHFWQQVNTQNLRYQCTGFLRRFRDPIRVPRISNRVPRIRENYHRVPKITANRVRRIREIGSLQIRAGFLTFSLKKILSVQLISVYIAQHIVVDFFSVMIFVKLKPSCNPEK